MGVPAFFRWLSRKYPIVVIECHEERNFDTETGDLILPDTSKPNPNGIEFDNLYLDMNGIIHPCTHPEDKPAPKNEDEMMVAIFQCIDRIFAIVRPRKLLYMAIDGVAPRAKMNQQRSRRFRASKESAEKNAEILRIRKKMMEQGIPLPPEKEKESHFDSNCITPGTPFMDRLSKCLHYYVHDRMNNDPGWKSIKVILSDANCPGEGEHKIMDFIRRQRAQPDHNPNTHHVLCGADADLIMLGLATHEPYFTIIREEFLQKPRPCDICGKVGHEMKDCLGGSPEPEDSEKPCFSLVNYIFVRLSVLREYLFRDLQMPNLPFKFDFERAIDDWVFMCFFVGNDFLPHLPSLEIREGAIDRLIKLYKDCCFRTGGWLTDSGQVNLSRVQIIMQQLGIVEDEIFKTRYRRAEEFKQREKMKRKQAQIEKETANKFKDEIGKGAFGVMRAGQTGVAHGARQEIRTQRLANMNDRNDLRNTLSQNKGQKRSVETQNESDDEEPPDEVRLHEEGFKDRYYESKFEVEANNLLFRYMVGDHYAIGLCWVLRYYYQGCASWNWYFPYHYAPFASDFAKCSNVTVKFDKGEPFNPLEQLMAVFPAASRSHVPQTWGKLMTSADSEIIDFYPEDFKIDLNGKRFAWQGVALLPFVDENRLKKALHKVYDTLTKDEKTRNKRGSDRLYVSHHNPAYKELRDLYRIGMDFDTEVPITAASYGGMAGFIKLANDCVPHNGMLISPVAGLSEIIDSKVACVGFRDPQYPKDFVFPSIRLAGAKDPPNVLAQKDAPNRRPLIGFTSDLPRASLSESGHRTLRHNLNQWTPGPYSNVPPTQNLMRGNFQGNMNPSVQFPPPYQGDGLLAGPYRRGGFPRGLPYQARGDGLLDLPAYQTHMRSGPYGGSRPPHHRGNLYHR